MRSARLSTAARGSMLALALAVASSALPGALSPAQGTTPRMAHPGGIIVQTVDTSINPIAAEIVFPAFGLGIRLSEEGAALLLNIPDGLYVIQARRLGYRPDWGVARVRGDTARVDFVLAPADGAGSSLAEARLRAFLRRTGEMQVASFITRSEIDRRRPRNLMALLGRVSDARVDRAGAGAVILRSRRALRPDCGPGMLLFVDGMQPNPSRLGPEAPPERAGDQATPGWRAGRTIVPRGSAADPTRWAVALSARQPDGFDPASRPWPTRSRRTTSALDWLPISLVSAVEVYPSITDVPPEFRVAGAECGVVLIWTRRE